MSKVISCASSLGGVIDDIEISKIKHPLQQLRTNEYEVTDLASSIRQKGLLQPIIIRMKEDKFEIVAGNRRYEACKALGWRKITCHIEDLSDREAYEISLTENIQRSSLNPVDEAKAFKTYVSDYGWGGVTELASKIGRSVSYVTKRIALLELPQEVLTSISNYNMSSSIGEELCSVKDNAIRSELAYLVSQRHLSVRKVRQLVENISDDDTIHDYLDKVSNYDDNVKQIQKYIDKSIIVLRVALNRIAMIIEDVKDDSWVCAEILLQHKNMIHSQIDILLKEKRKINDRIIVLLDRD